MRHQHRGRRGGATGRAGGVHTNAPGPRARVVAPARRGASGPKGDRVASRPRWWGGWARGILGGGTGRKLTARTPCELAGLLLRPAPSRRGRRLCALRTAGPACLMSGPFLGRTRPSKRCPRHPQRPSASLHTQGARAWRGGRLFAGDETSGGDLQQRQARALVPGSCGVAHGGARARLRLAPSNSHRLRLPPVPCVQRGKVNRAPFDYDVQAAVCAHFLQPESAYTGFKRKCKAWAAALRTVGRRAPPRASLALTDGQQVRLACGPARTAVQAPSGLREARSRRRLLPLCAHGAFAPRCAWATGVPLAGAPSPRWRPARM